MARGHLFGSMQIATSCISVTMVLVLLGCALFVTQLMNRFSRYMRENLVVTVMIADDAPEEEVRRYAVFLKETDYVSDAVLITREQALKEQSEAMGTDPTEFLGINPFSASVDVKLSAEYANTDSLKWITSRLKDSDMVTDVVYHKDLIDNVNNNVRRVTMALLVLALLLTVVSFALINNTVRLSIYSRRFVIHTMCLVGASWGFIRKPFIKRAFWLGMVSALFADVLLLAGVQALVLVDPALAMFITRSTMLVMAGGVILVGLAITILCSWLTVNRYLRMHENDMY